MKNFENIVFTENGTIDAGQLNDLYRIIGWDNKGQRTLDKTKEMLQVSHYYIAAYDSNAQLVGFARVCGDPYIVQVLDVITHPDYRRQGIATGCMKGIVNHLQHANYVYVSLMDESGLEGFYQRFGFRSVGDSNQFQVWHRNT